MEMVNIKSLIFNSNDDHVELVVEIRKMLLSYPTTYMIDVFNLNRILNLIQKNNPEIELYEYIQTTDYLDFQEFNLDLNMVKGCWVNKEEVDFMIVNSLKKQIRA